jgi:rubredoxin
MKKWVEADADLGRRDPARKWDERGRVRQRELNLLGDLAHGGGAQILVAVDGAAGEDPGAAHEPRLRRPPAHQHLEPLRTPAYDRDRGGEPRRRRFAALVEDRAGLGTVRHWGSLICARMSTDTGRQWICESCGFIYDPTEGDPDGGIPAGTAFEDIPADWYCPVCGARKADFSPYEG